MLQNPYVFIVGCPRSGTTLLQRMLDHHPLLTVAYDTHFIPHGPDHSEVENDPLLTPDIVMRVRAFPRFSRLGLADSVVEEAASASRTYSEFVSRLYSELAAMNGKPLAGEKTPVYTRFIPLLEKLFPRARFIHLIRDGRDVTLSFLTWATKGGRRRGPSRYMLWDEQPVGMSAMWWRDRVVEGRRNGQTLPSRRYLEVHFEDLTAKPRETLSQILSFLELPFSEDPLEYHRGRARPKPGKSPKAAWLPPTPGLRNWRTQMAPGDVELFEAIAGDVLAEIGYERRYPRPSRDVSALADRYRSWWESERQHGSPPHASSASGA